MTNFMRTEPIRIFLVALSVAWMGFVATASDSAAQSDPTGKTICEIPSYRGTAAYAQYCGGGGGVSSGGGGGGGGYQQFLLQGAGVLGGALGSALHDELFGNPQQEEAKRQASAAQAAAREAEEQRRAAEAARRADAIRDQLLGNGGGSDSAPFALKGVGNTTAISLKGVDDTTELKLKTGDQTPLFGSTGAKCVPSQDASLVDLCGLGTTVDPNVVKYGSAAPAFVAPPANPTLPSVAEIENSPGATDAHAAFQAIVNKDWPGAVASFKAALAKDPGNAALKRSLDLAEYTQARREELSHLNSPISDAIDTWRSGNDKAALAQLNQIEKQHPDMKDRVADVRHGILAVEKYEKTPAYRADLAKMAQEQNQLVFDAALDEAQKSMADQYKYDAMQFVVKGDIPAARVMLKTALADDKNRGDIKTLLDTLDSFAATLPPVTPRAPTKAAASDSRH